MTYPQQFYDDASELFREYMGGLTPDERLFAEAAIQALTGVRSVSNVRLWYRTDLAQRRNYLNRKVTGFDLETRYLILRATNGMISINKPQRTKEFRGKQGEAIGKLEMYWNEPYIFENITTLTFFPNGWRITYNADSDANEMFFSDEDSEEFGDLGI